MTTSELPSLLERTRMALAEVGYPDAHVSYDGDLHIDGSVPFDVAWRACEIAWSERPITVCQACASIASERNDRAISAACLADRPCVMDCGLDRGER